MRSEFASAADLPVGFWRWPHVHPTREWACKGDWTLVVESDFLDLLEQLRTAFGRPLLISSGYRSPAHNQAVSTTGADGPHTTARAVDIQIYGAYALELVKVALGLGFTGFGFSQKGLASRRFVHLDNLTAPDYPRPNIWTY